MRAKGATKNGFSPKRKASKPLEHPECPETVAERVHYVFGLMCQLEYVRGKTTNELSEKWGLAVSTIENYTAEASRRIYTDPETARFNITAGCQALFKDAVARGDAKGARAVGELWANVAGAKSPELHKVDASVEATANPDAAAALVRQLFGTLKSGS